MFFEFCLGLRTADFLFSIRHIASNTVHRDILSLGLLRSLWWKPTHLTSVFSLQTSILSPPDGTTLMAFTDVAKC